MKKPIFSGKMYVQSLKRVRTLGIAVMIAVVLLNMFLPIMGIIDSIQMDRRREEYAYPDFQDGTNSVYVDKYGNIIESSVDFDYPYAPPEPSKIEDWEFAPFLWSMMGFAPLLVIAMFSFLNERKQSDFYHALPHTRVCMYLSMTAAIFTWLLGVILVSTGVNALLWSFAKYYTVSVASVFANIAFYFVLGIFMSGSLAVAMMITGTVTSNLLIYAFLMLFPRYLVLIFQSSLDSAIDILPNVMDYFTILSFTRFLPFCWIDGTVLNDGYMSDPAMIIYSLVIGLLMFVLAGVLYHFRRSESATKSAPNNLAQHIYRIAFTTAMAITIPFAIVMDGLNEVVILLFFFTVVVHVLYELMTTRKIKKMVKSLPLLIIPFILAGVFGATIAGTRAYVYSVRPDADDVKSVTFSDINYITYGEYKLQEFAFTDEETIKLGLRGLYNVLDGTDYPKDGDVDWFTVSYKLKSGRTIHRSVWLATKDWKALCMADKVTDVYLALPTADEISHYEVNPLPSGYKWNDELSYGEDSYQATQKKIWNMFCEEYNALSEEKKMELLSYSDYRKRYDSFYIITYVKEPGTNLRNYMNSFYYVLVPDLTPNTVDYIMSLYGTEEQILYTLEKLKTDEAENDVHVSFMNDSLYTDTWFVEEDIFFDSITLDSHLFNDDGIDVMVVIRGYEYWLNLTEKELNAVLREYNGMDYQDYEKYKEYYDEAVIID